MNNDRNAPLCFARCGEDMLDELCRIQEEAFDKLPDPSLLRRNTRDMLGACLSEPHCTLGAFCGDVLAAFGVLWRGGQTEENLGKLLDLDGEQLERIYNVKLIIVRPPYRGAGLQRELLRRLESIARADGCRMLCATVAPANGHSMRNFIAEGYAEYGTFNKYGGLERKLLYKELSEK